MSPCRRRGLCGAWATQPRRELSIKNADPVQLAGRTRHCCLHHLVREQARRNPNAIAILAPGRTPLTYGRLSRQVEDVVEALNSLGIGRNDRVAMVLPEGPEMAVAFIAIAAGATCAPLNPAYRASEFDFYLADLNSRALLVLSGSASPAVAVAQARGIPVLELSPASEAEAGFFTLAGESRPGLMQHGFAQPDDAALALHTSGTTARPKLVPLTHRNIYTSAHNIRAAVELTDSDRCLNVMPLFHIHGLSTIFASLAAGASVVCIPGFSAPQFFEWLEEFRPTWYTAAPTIHQIILENARLHPEITAHSPLRFIRSASSAMPRQVMADLERIFRVPFIEAYGMTEAAPQIASNRLPPHKRKPGSVGLAAGPDVAIMDEAGNLMPPGETGEVVIRGVNVMQAYENNSTTNRSAFTQGWFRTGDLGHVDSDDYLFITGRLKEIISRGGEKISPREVDEVLMDHPAVEQAVTFAVPHPTLGESVAAAIVLRESTSGTEAEIRRFAATRLADFKVPQQVVIVDEIPKGPTGKLQRIGLAEKLGLAAPGSEQARAQVGLSAPSTPTEQRLMEIWADVLGLERLGIHDNFFELGGDSLMATQVIARLRDALQVELPIASLFDRPTVAELGELIAQCLADKASVTGTVTIPRRSATDPCRLSFAQQRLWFLDQIEPANPAYNIHVALRLTGALSVPILEQSLSEILRRHEALRTTFRTVDGQPVQIIASAKPLRLPVVDLSGLRTPDRETEVQRLAAEEAGSPFHLARGPLFRTMLLRLDAEEHVLLLTMHHIVSDGWSTEVLYRELGTLYEAFSAAPGARAAGGSPLPELPIQYADYAVWQRDWLQGEVLETQLAYWKEQLGDSPPMLALPTDRPRPTLQTYRGARHEMVISRRATEGLKALSQREGAPLFTTLLAAFQTLLSRYTGQDDLLVGTPIANRTRVETERLIGFFANTLALRTDLSGDPTFLELLGRVREVALGAYAHQDLPFEKVVEELQPKRDLSHMPLFQVMFAFQNVLGAHGVGGSSLKLAPGLTACPLQVDSGVAKFDLTLYLSETEQGLKGSWQYNIDLFEAATIERMAEHFQALLDGIVANPERSLSKLPLLSDVERYQLLVAWNQTEAPYPHDRCFHHLFEEQVERTPDAVAVRCEEERLTYGELNGRANQLARRLQRLGVGP
ncbi:MAG TPA: condensation domain-containing protein, partial [Gemmatimonadales bacterium]|nr:condensation domain-containing protein [Gemmatimonadales bacterium]